MIEFVSVIISLLLTANSAAHPLNTTNLPPVIPSANVTLPPGTTNHGDPNLLCRPATWFTVLSFIFANYLAHAGTTAIFPGEKTGEQALAFATSFLFPSAGVSRGMNSILRGLMVIATRGESELQQAAAAGALCMVIRTQKWKPTETQVHGVKRSQLSGDVDPAAEMVYNWHVWEPPSLGSTHYDFTLPDEITNRAEGLFEAKRRIHGANKKLPSGYAYTLVPPTAIIKPTLDPPISIDPPLSIQIAQSRSFIKVLVAVFQVVYSSWTLYEARGDQIDRFGYAAFSLTVSPYVVMSLINLVGSLLLPSYPALFLVRSEVMVEVEQQHDGRCFDGVVGTLQQALDGNPSILTTEQVAKENTIVLSADPDGDGEPRVTIPACAHFEERDIRLGRLTMAKPNSSLEGLSSLCKKLSVTFGFLAPLSIVLGLSHFHKGRSSLAERVWIMLWYTLGCLVPLAIRGVDSPSGADLRSYMRPPRVTNSPRVDSSSSRWPYVVRVRDTLRSSLSSLSDSLQSLFNRLLHRLDIDPPLLMHLAACTVYGVLGIGAMVMVGRMIKEYGDCTRF